MVYIYPVIENYFISLFFMKLFFHFVMTFHFPYAILKEKYYEKQKHTTKPNSKTKGVSYENSGL